MLMKIIVEIIMEKNMLDLFNKPNKFAKAGKEYSYSNKGKKK